KYFFVLRLDIEFYIAGFTELGPEAFGHFIDEITFDVFIVLDVLQVKVRKMENFLPIQGRIPGPEPGNVVPHVDHRELILVREYPGTPSDHLEIEGERTGGPVQDDGPDTGLIKACGEDAHRGQDGIRGIG